MWEVLRVIPSTLLADLNSFYEREFPRIPRIAVTTWGELAEGGRQVSFVDGYFLHRFASEISPRAEEYIYFVKSMLQKFQQIEVFFNNNVKADGDHKDAQARPGGWAGFGVLPLALSFYTAAKDGVEGDYLECGVFKGGSLTCMSHVANFLGRKAIAADTFEGLPEGDATGYWQKNQFVGRLDDVKSNVAAAGVIDSVVWEKGLFSDTLPNLDKKIAVVFLDTDLYNSSISALNSIKDKFSPASVVASDGVSGIRDFVGGEYFPEQNEAAAVRDFFKGSGPYHAVWTGNGNMSLFRRKSSLGVAPLYSTSLMHYLTNAFYSHKRFEKELLLRDRNDLPNITNKSNTTLEDISEFITADIMNELIIANYYMGGLEWKLMTLQGESTA